MYCKNIFPIYFYIRCRYGLEKINTNSQRNCKKRGG